MAQIYKDWVRSNAGTVTALESSLSALTWLLPNRFTGSELALEAVQAALGLLQLCNERILAPEPPQALLAFWLGIIREVEVLVELGAVALEQRGSADRHTPLVALEAVKAALRVCLLRQQGGRLLVNGGQGTFTPAAGAEAKLQAVSAAFARFRDSHGVIDSLAAPRAKEGLAEQLAEGRYWWDGEQRAAALGQSASVSAEEEKRAAEAARAEERRQVAAQLLAFGELAFTLRPLLWGRRSWKPWILSLALELGSAGVLSRGASLSNNAGKAAASKLPGRSAHLKGPRSARWTPVEQEEVLRRRRQLAWYLIRSPFFDAYTRPGLDRAQGVLKHVPLLGTLSDKGLEILYGIQQYWTYTSAS